MRKKKSQKRNRIVYKIKKAFLKRTEGKDFPEIWMSKDSRFFDDDGIVPEGRRVMEEHLWNEYQVKKPGEKNPWTRKAMAESGKWTHHHF